MPEHQPPTNEKATTIDFSCATFNLLDSKDASYNTYRSEAKALRLDARKPRLCLQSLLLADNENITGETLSMLRHRLLLQTTKRRLAIHLKHSLQNWKSDHPTAHPTVQTPGNYTERELHGFQNILL